ncbi:hypothetical protein [Candidatus Galacturonibacter soehngenii]|nr:hypothetical protein [Candidatus Galacturonibacter soehngenii]
MVVKCNLLTDKIVKKRMYGDYNVNDYLAMSAADGTDLLEDNVS